MGNFNINDEPTGAVVSQQPFSGGRASGTNDKAASYLNLIRWATMRSIKETFVPPTHFAYPFMGEELTVGNQQSAVDQERKARPEPGLFMWALVLVSGVSS